MNEDLEILIKRVLERLDNIEKRLDEVQNDNKIDIIAFEKIQTQIKLISPIAMNNPRDKCNLKVK